MQLISSQPSAAAACSPRLAPQMAPYAVLSVGLLSSVSSFFLLRVLAEGGALPRLAVLLPPITCLCLGGGLVWLTVRHAGQPIGLLLGLMLALALPVIAVSAPLVLLGLIASSRIATDMVGIVGWISTHAVTLLFVGQPLAFGIVALLLARRLGAPPIVLGLRRTTRAGLTAGLALGVGGWIVSLGYTKIVPAAAMTAGLFHQPDHGLAVFAVVAIFLAPLGEELFFRGYALAVTARMSSQMSPLIAAGMFAAAHMQPLATPFLLAMGLGLWYLRRTTNSLLPVVIAHACFNALGCAVLLFAGG